MHTQKKKTTDQHAHRMTPAITCTHTCTRVCRLGSTLRVSVLGLIAEKRLKHAIPCGVLLLLLGFRSTENLLCRRLRRENEGAPIGLAGEPCLSVLARVCPCTSSCVCVRAQKHSRAQAQSHSNQTSIKTRATSNKHKGTSRQE